MVARFSTGKGEDNPEVFLRELVGLLSKHVFYVQHGPSHPKRVWLQKAKGGILG